MGVLQVARDETSEAFLSCGVPELQTVGLVAVDKVLNEKIDADGGLDVAACTLYDSSYRLLMNRSIMDVFPTCWSPSNTILYLVRPPTVELDKLITYHY